MPICRIGLPTKIGLYTSPHLRYVKDRYQINGVPLSEELLTVRFLFAPRATPILALGFVPCPFDTCLGGTKFTGFRANDSIDSVSPD
jgi:hypothetical protein